MISLGSSFFGTGTTFACFHSLGTLPWASDIAKSSVKDGASSVAHSLNNVADIPSGPVALVVQRPDNKQQTSSAEIVIDSRPTASVLFAGFVAEVDGVFGQNTDVK